MTKKTLFNPREITSLAWECPDCQSMIMVQRPQGEAVLFSADCPVCVGSSWPEPRSRPYRTDFQAAFRTLDSLAERGISIILTEEEQGQSG